MTVRSFSDRVRMSANSIILPVILLSILLFCGCSPAGTPSPAPAVGLTLPRPSETSTSTPSPTATPVQTGTPTSISSPVYYMIVIDASEQMDTSFDGQTKSEAAREAAETILDGLEPDANYGLAVIGGAPTIKEIDPCDEPSVVKRTFSARNAVSDQIAQLQPAGEGSLYTAFFLAKNQFEGLPANTVRALIYISGLSDACKSRDQWAQLENLFKVPFGVDPHLYSEIIILDDSAEAQLIAGRLNDASKNIHVQVAESVSVLRQAYRTAVDNVRNYVSVALASLPTQTPDMTSTSLPTLEQDTPTMTASSTLTPLPLSPTLTLSPSSTPSPTPTQQPSVELLSARYLTTGIGCQADIIVRVTGSPATGSFHVWNVNYGPEGRVDAMITLPVGTYSGNPVTLGGHQPESYFHDVWFEYDGTQSNRLEGLKCPLLPLSTATP